MRRPSVRVRRGYLITLIGSVLLALIAGSALLVTSHRAAVGLQAEQRAEARDQAARNRSFKAFSAKATALLPRLPVPAGFSRDPGPACAGQQPALCLASPLPPRQSLDTVLASLRPLGLGIQVARCTDPAALSQRFRSIWGKTWAPCSAQGALGGVHIAVTSLAAFDPKRSTRGHVVFRGSSVTVALVWNV